MRFFKWSLIRTARLAEIHARSKKLDAENNILVQKNRSLQNTVTIHEETIEEQKAKSSLVQVSERENRIKELEDKIIAMKDTAIKKEVLAFNLVTQLTCMVKDTEKTNYWINYYNSEIERLLNGEDAKMSGDGLSEGNSKLPDILQTALVQPPLAVALGDSAEGLQHAHGSAVSGSNATKQTGD